MPLSCAFLLTACDSKPKAREPAAKPTPTQNALPVVADGRGLLFSFFDHKAELRTVDRLAKVESTAQSSVMVIDPKRRLSDDRIFVADLRKESKTTGFLLHIEKRSVWLARTMPRQSRLAKPLKLARAKGVPSKKRHRKVKSKRPRKVKKAAASSKVVNTEPVQAAPAPKRQAQVLLFSTTWCPSCRSAKAFFLQKGVPFVELDIERDPRAARQYAAIARARGLRPGSVPMIVVGRQVFMGFSRFQIELALNQLPKS